MLPGWRWDVQLVDNGSTVVVGLTASSWGNIGDWEGGWCCDSISGTVVLELTAVVSMVMVGLESELVRTRDRDIPPWEAPKEWLGLKLELGITYALRLMGGLGNGSSLLSAMLGVAQPGSQRLNKSD